MKATELMIGDVVTFKDCQNDAIPTIVEIWQVSADGNALVFIDGSKALDEITVDDDVVGLPLTAEILGKNGFEEDGGYWLLEDKETEDYLLLLGKISNAFVLFTAGITIGLRYVHELQHLYRICGISKQIEL